MQLEINTNRKKHKIYKITICFFIIIGLLTFFSKTISNFLLPKVTVTQLQKGSLGDVFENEGVVEYKAKNRIYSTNSWLIKKINVNVNKFIKKGDFLAQIENDDILLQKKSAQLNVLKAEDILRSLKNETEPNKDLIKEKEIELEIAKLQYEKVSKGIDEDGNILADSDGKIIGINAMEGSVTQPNQVIFEMVSDMPQYCVSWKVNEDEAIRYKVGDKISVRIKIRQNNAGNDATLNFKDLVIESNVINKQYLSNEKVYELSANLNSKGIVLEEGQKATISINKSSPSYNQVIPKRCVTEENRQNYIFVVKERQGILGKEKYVAKVQVNIVDSDTNNCAIKDVPNDVNQIVLDSSKPLTDDLAVMLR